MRTKAWTVLPIVAALAHALAAGVAAAPNPANNPNALLIDAACESGDVTFATISQNLAVVGQIVEGGTGTMVIVDAKIWDNPEMSGDPSFTFGARGFDHSAVTTEICFVDNNPVTPGLYYRLEVIITPAS